MRTFTDDGCRPDADWLQSGLRGFEDSPTWRGTLWSTARFRARIPDVPHGTASLWEATVPIFDGALAACFDTARSALDRVVAAGGQLLAARLDPGQTDIVGSAGGAVIVPVHVMNLSPVPLSRGTLPFPSSCHLWSSPGGEPRRFDNPRTRFDEPLLPGDGRIVNVPVAVPVESGTYEIQFDVVWEGVAWMKDCGNPTARVQLSTVGSCESQPDSVFGGAV